MPEDRKARLERGTRLSCEGSTRRSGRELPMGFNAGGASDGAPSRGCGRRYADNARWREGRGLWGGRPYDDPIWNIVGIDGADGPRDVARNKHSYLAEAYTHDHTTE